MLPASPASPMRTSRRLKSCSSRKAFSRSMSRSPRFKSDSGRGSGVSSRNRTRSRLIRACSAKLIRFSRRLGCLIVSACASKLSRSPKLLISSAAVFTPIPGTPGTLSVESPASACTSTTLSGLTPKRSNTSASPMRRCFIGSSIVIPPRTSCIRSLSDETIMVSRPAASPSAA